MEVSLEALKRMQSMHIMELKREELTDAKDIVIDTTQSREERMKAYIEQTGNPYAQNVGEYIVQVGFMEGASDSLEERMLLLFKRKVQDML